MTPLLPELERFPVPGVFDGELIAFNDDGEVDFVALTDRMLLTREPSIPIAFVAFDDLNLDGKNLITEPYWRRREILVRQLRRCTPPRATGRLHRQGH